VISPRLEAYLLRYRERYGLAGCRTDAVSDGAILRAVRGVHLRVAREKSHWSLAVSLENAGALRTTGIRWNSRMGLWFDAAERRWRPRSEPVGGWPGELTSG
jgi:hypothetical protein